MRLIYQFRISYLAKMKYIIVLFAIVFSFASQESMAQNNPERAILFIIDGLHIEAPTKLEMPNFSKLAKQGSLIERTYGIMPYHPTHGEYAEVHTSSYPNPVMMTGTIFLEPNQRMLQHSFDNNAFVANTSSYQSITDGYQFVVQKDGPDKFSVDKAIRILDDEDLDFIRVHLQAAGGAGYQSYTADDDKTYKYNIWDKESPYIDAVREADRQLGRFISELKKIGKWEGTLLVVTSDHGQTKTGWHPILPEESWQFPTIFYGPNVKKDYTLEWGDQIDIIPTIAHLMDVQIPNEDGGTGRTLYNLVAGESNDSPSSSRLLKFNRILARYFTIRAEMLANSSKHPYLNSSVMLYEREFYGLNRIMDWKDLKSIDSLNDHNEQIVDKMEKELNNAVQQE